MRSFTGFEKVYARIRRYRPVIVLAASVYSGKRFFMKQANKAVLACYILHKLHCELVVIACYICRGEYGSKLVLSGCDFVVLCFSKLIKAATLGFMEPK